MYDGSAGFDLADAIYLGRALSEAGYLWYEEPMREFSITAYQRLSERVDVPLLVAETSDGAHMNAADFIASGCATFVRTSSHYKGGITGAMRVAPPGRVVPAAGRGARRRPAEHPPVLMAMPNTTYYESLVDTNPVRRAAEVDADGLVHAPTAPGMGYEAGWGSDMPPLTVAEDSVRDR